MKILNKLDALDTKIDDTKDHLSQRIDNNIAKTDQLAEKCNEVKDEAAGLKTQATVHGVRLDELEAKIEQLEREKRRTTLIIDGVQEEQGEDTADIVDQIFEDIGVDYTKRLVVNIYRRGRRVTVDSDRKQGKQ